MTWDCKELEARGVNRLLCADPGPVPPERHPWRREVLCYSEIAFSVVVSLEVERSLTANGNEDESKAALYRYVKHIQLTLLESGLVYPLVVVAIADANSAVLMRRWASDQDWHRGDFILEVEENRDKARARVIDLLSLKVEKLMGERRRVRSVRDYIEAMESRLPESGKERELGNMILDTWRSYEGRTLGDRDGYEMRDKLDAWVHAGIADARRVIEGAGS